ncbi:MAG: sulfite reductase subunit alpha [Verrucomicrobiota bacterium]
MSSAPSIPETAPFTPEQRQWLNGLLAGMFSGNEALGASEPVAKKPEVVVLYGSQSGNTETLADSFGERLNASGFQANVVSMEDHEEVDLASKEHVLLLSSTWGDGDPPDSAIGFWEKLSAEDHPRMEKLQFSVLALGDTNYLTFCEFGKQLDSRLEALGATRMAARVDCDTDFEEPADKWFSAVLTGLESTTGAGTKTETSTAPPKKAWGRSNPFPAKLKTNLELNSKESARDTRHFEIELGDSGLSYEAGDALGVIPTNCPQYVEDLLQAAGYTGDEPIGDKTLRQALTEDYAITLPSPKLMIEFASRADSAELTALLDDKEKMADYLWGREIVDLFVEYPKARWSAEEFVGLLSKMAPRLYSISSSSKAHPGEVHLTVARVGYETHGRERKGVASTFLSDRIAEDGAVPIYVQPNKHFKVPADTQAPMIMVGPGTGIAPFRAFLEERQATHSPGKNWLFFGNPHESSDYLYQEQLEAAKADGSLARLDLAWSRDGAEKVYVQDLMRKSAQELWAWLEEGAYFFVCGDAKRMAKDVDKALHAAIETAGGKTPEEAAAYVNDLKTSKRYVRDVY